MEKVRATFDQLVAWLRRTLPGAKDHPKAVAILAGLIIIAIVVLPPYPFP